jgi:hypothetical protein
MSCPENVFFSVEANPARMSGSYAAVFAQEQIHQAQGNPAVHDLILVADRLCGSASGVLFPDKA